MPYPAGDLYPQLTGLYPGPGPGRIRGLKWALCDVNGARLAQFFDRKSAFVTVPFNDHRQVNLNVPIDDAASGLIVPLRTKLKVYLGARLLFVGPTMTPSFQGKARTVKLTAMSEDWRLERRFLSVDKTYDNVDAGDIIWDLIQTFATSGDPSIPGHGIVLGQKQATIRITETYQRGQSVWQAIQSIIGLLDGPDIEFDPIDAEDGNLVTLNIMQRQGIDRTESARFAFNTMNQNLDDFQWDPSGEAVRNRFTGVGQGDQGVEPVALANHLAAQQGMGIYEGFEASIATSDPGVLTARAKQMVAAYGEPPDFFTMTPFYEALEPGYAIPPQAFSDYFIGDDVHVAFVMAGIKDAITGRCTEIKLTEADDAANVKADVVCQPTVIASGVS